MLVPEWLVSGVVVVACGVACLGASKNSRFAVRSGNPDPGAQEGWDVVLPGSGGLPVFMFLYSVCADVYQMSNHQNTDSPLLHVYFHSGFLSCFCVVLLSPKALSLQ